mmetsp:Transcript_95161/g.198964  ORF Transcript_95161/g.198964 Transcript_95161/m.198964 type:complete len:436 (-) Transcript_95161:34-1341(-)
MQQKLVPATRSDQIGNVHWHLINLRGVELFNVAQDSDVVALHEVDGHTLAAESAGSTNAVNVELSVVGQVVADDQGHLLDIQTTTPKVGGDQHPAGTGAELLHDGVSLLLGHVTVDSGNSEVGFSHLLGQPIHLLLGVAEDHGLSDGQGVVKIAQGVELPLLALHRNEELLDALQSQLISLHQHSEGLVHELVGHLEHLMGHGGRHQHHLGGRWQVSVDIVDLLLEAPVQHLIGLIQHQHLHGSRAEVSLLDHVEDTPGSSGDDVDTGLEGVDVIGNSLSSHAAVHLDVEVVAQGQADFLGLLGQLSGGRKDQSLGLPGAGDHGLQGAQAEDAGLAGTTLGLDDDIAALEDGQHCSLLDGRWSLEAVGIDSSQKVLLQAQGIEGRQNLHIFGSLEHESLVAWLARHVLEGCWVENSRRGRRDKDNALARNAPTTR